jgi:trans-aconitate methyltransferase
VTSGPLVRTYDSLSRDYQQAFRLFLDHTDQKTRARRWLDAMVEALPARRSFIDAGAGTGSVTAWLADRFDRTVALEPNPSLREELRRACPGIEILPDTIMDAKPPEQADLVLCSHVLYYIDPAEWPEHLEKMASWVGAQGELVVVLQSPDTDCMDMLAHFHHRRFDLGGAAAQLQKQSIGCYRVEIEHVPAHVRTSDRESAVSIAEFMLNLLPIPEPPPRQELEDYVTARFTSGDGFRFSCHQDFLRISASARP